MSTAIVIKGLALYVTDLLLWLIKFHVQAFAKRDEMNKGNQR